MKNSTVRATQLTLALGLIVGVAFSTASAAGTVKAGAYDTAIQRGMLTEPDRGYERGYTTRIIVDEGYHDWDSRTAYESDARNLEKAEFAAFEESYEVPWELDVVD